MTHFPLFFDLKDKKVLTFGGGAFTLQRIEKLKPLFSKDHRYFSKDQRSHKTD